MTSHRLRDIIARHGPWLAILISAAAIGGFYRLYPLRHAAATQNWEKATLLVAANLRQTLREQLDAAHPGLSEADREAALRRQMQEIMARDKDQMKRAVAQAAAGIPGAAGGETGQYPYLLGSDSYNFLALTENVLATGRLGPEKRGSKFLNPLMLAPLGYYEPFTLHPYIGAGLHRIISAWRPDAPVRYSVSWTPLLITLLALVPFLALCRSWSTGILPALTGSVYLLLAPVFIRRSAFGWYDNDPYNILFPLLILWGLTQGFGPSGSRRRLPGWGLFTAGLFALYAMFWQGWMFLLCTVLLGLIVSAIVHAVRRTGPRPAEHALFIGALAAGTLAGMTAVFGAGDIIVLFAEGLKALREFSRPALPAWPDLYIGVGELRSSSFSKLLQDTGGVTALVLSLIGAGVTAVQIWRRPQDRTAPVRWTVLIFFVLAVLLSLRAQRFILLLAVPQGLLIAAGVAGLQRALSTALHRRWPAESRPGRIAAGTASVLLCGLLIIPPLRVDVPASLSLAYDDAWDEALRWMDQNTPADSIVNTWWPPGHFIKATAHRRVTFDGATINKPQAYWLASIFLSPDETTALGMLRMLNASANRAAEFLQAQGLPLADTVTLLKDIAPLSREDARQRLSDTLTAAAAETLLNLTHPDQSPPSYLLIYRELIDNNIQFKFVAGWNFEAVAAANSSAERRALIPPSKSPEYISFLWKLAGGMPRFSGVLTAIQEQGPLIRFEHNITVDRDHHRVIVDSEKFGRGVARSLWLRDGETVTEYPQPGANLAYSVVVFQEGGHWQCALMDQDLARSLLMRLYFFDGAGMERIKEVKTTRSVGGRNEVKIFEVEW